MSIIRKKHTAHYTVIPNHVWDDDRLKLDAKGMLGYLLSRPDNWTGW